MPLRALDAAAAATACSPSDHNYIHKSAEELLGVVI